MTTAPEVTDPVTATPTPDPTALPVTPALPPADPDVRFTAKDIEKARQQEKDKLYDRISPMEEELKRLRKDREDREAKDAERAQKAKDAVDAKHRDEASAKDLLDEANRQWEQKFAGLEAQRQQEAAVHEAERQFQALREYAQNAVRNAGDDIAPQLVDYITGNTQAEIDASLEMAKAKTAAILEEVAQSQQVIRSQQRGVSATGYAPTGVMDTAPGSEQYTTEQIAAMTPNEWAKHRNKFIGQGNTNNRGLFG